MFVRLLIDYKIASALYGLSENKALHLTLISKANTHISQKSCVFLGETISVPKHLLPASLHRWHSQWRTSCTGMFPVEMRFNTPASNKDRIQ